MLGAACVTVWRVDDDKRDEQGAQRPRVALNTSDRRSQTNDVTPAGEARARVVIRSGGASRHGHVSGDTPFRAVPLRLSDDPVAFLTLPMSTAAPPASRSASDVPLGTGLPTKEELIAHYPAKFSWTQLRAFVNAGDLGLLKRDRALQKRYDSKLTSPCG
jgi:hypothetical protein